MVKKITFQSRRKGKEVNKMQMTIRFNPETKLIELESSGGTLSMSQTEAGALYLLLRKALGRKGRMKLFMKRKMFTQV